jgi:hydroxymethylbilane synthase
MKIVVGARSSPLSRAQFEEVRKTLPRGIEFMPVWVKTTGDIDKQTSLRNLDKTNFFTKELDEMLLQGEIRISIHSAKDLPDPIPDGLSLVALTKGVDPRDSLVFRSNENLDTASLIATSSERREAVLCSLRSGLRFVDLRGTIGERLALLENGTVDGVVVAEAALIRLGLTHLNRLILPGETVPLQGRLAILARKEDQEMHCLFCRLDL